MSAIQITQKKEFLAHLEAQREAIARLMPSGSLEGADRVIRVARTAYQGSVALQRCDPASVIKAIMLATELGLEVGVRREAHLVPYDGKCALIFGYSGLLKVARRSPNIGLIDSQLVHERDQFSVRHTPAVTIDHQPYLGPDPGAITHVYAYIKEYGDWRAIVMRREEVEAIRQTLPERQQNSPAWRNYWGEMARKVCLKRLLKYAPVDDRLIEAMQQEDSAIYADPAPDGRRPGETRTQALARQLTDSRADPEPIEDDPHDDNTREPGADG